MGDGRRAAGRARRVAGAGLMVNVHMSMTGFLGWDIERIEDQIVLSCE